MDACVCEFVCVPLKVKQACAAPVPDPAHMSHTQATKHPLDGFTDDDWARVNSKIQAMVDNGKFEFESETDGSESKRSENGSVLNSLHLQS